MYSFTNGDPIVVIECIFTTVQWVLFYHRTVCSRYLLCIWDNIQL